MNIRWIAFEHLSCDIQDDTLNRAGSISESLGFILFNVAIAPAVCITSLASVIICSRWYASFKAPVSK